MRPRRVRRNANSVMNPLEILKLHNHRNFAARDVILNGDYSDAGVRVDSLEFTVAFLHAGVYGGW